MRVTLITLLTVSLSSFVFASGDHAGGHGAAHWMAPEAAAKRRNPVKYDSDSVARGVALFQQKCAVCHGKTAQGDGPAAKSLKPKPTNLQKMSGDHPDGDFAWKIENGRGSMPAWKKTLSKNQIWDIVNYIQSLSKMDKHDKKSDHHHDDDKHAH